MGWSLDYLAPKEPELLDKFFLAVGKSLYLASSFESKCQWILRIAKMAAHYESTGNATETMSLASAMRDKLLGPTIRDMKSFPEFTEDDITKLEHAKDARNYIAHESTEIGALSSASAKTIAEKLTKLRCELENLIIGDNLVSRWVYEIQETEPAPRGIQTAYPYWVLQWVFEVYDVGT